MQLARVHQLHGTRPTVHHHQTPEVRPRAAPRGPARSIQPGHIEFGTGTWVLPGYVSTGIAFHTVPTEIPSKHTNRLEELADLNLYLSRSDSGPANSYLL